LDWVIPPVGPGGGGATTISRFISEFNNRGVSQRISIYAEHAIDIQNQRKILREYFRIPLNIEIHIYSENLTSYAVIATAWQTFSASVRKKSLLQPILFLQDKEDLFEPFGDSQILISKSLPKFGLCISAGTWLRKYAIENGIFNTTPFDFGVDEIYFPPSTKSKNRLVVYHQPEKPRRLPALTTATLETLYFKAPQIQILVVGSKIIDNNLYYAKQLGVLEPQILASLYRKSNIGLVFSGSNASLTPYEMLACGTNVITNIGDNSEWLGNFSSLYYCEKDPIQIANRIIELNSLEYIATPDVPTWEKVIDSFFSKFINEVRLTDYRVIFDA
jgi:hypothetical protein